jgi:hypothetical protein
MRLNRVKRRLERFNRDPHAVVAISAARRIRFWPWAPVFASIGD